MRILFFLGWRGKKCSNTNKVCGDSEAKKTEAKPRAIAMPRVSRPSVTPRHPPGAGARTHTQIEREFEFNTQAAQGNTQAAQGGEVGGDSDTEPEGPAHEAEPDSLVITLGKPVAPVPAVRTRARRMARGDGRARDARHGNSSLVWRLCPALFFPRQPETNRILISLFFESLHF